MTFAQIHAALESAEPDERFSLLGDPFPHLTALAMLTMIVRLPLVAFDPPAPGFSNRFPKNHMPPEAKAVFGKELGKYRTWRRLVLDCELLATGKGVDADHWDSLRRLARLTIGRAAAMNIYNVSARLPPDLPPWELDRRLALSVDAGLTKGQRQAYRAGLRVIDKLHFIAIAAASGLLPSDEIGRLPDLAAHDTHAPLPPKLKLFCNEAPRPVRNALMFTWRIAIASGIFVQGDDPAPQDLIAPSRFMRLSALNPQHFGFARPSNHTYSTYLRQLSRHIRPQPAFSPETDPVEAAWAALHSAAGKAGASAARLSALRVVSAAATEERLLPASLTPRWFTERLAAQPAARSNRFRHGCYLLDDLAEWGGLPASLLPIERTGLARLRARRGEGEATAASAAPASACADPVEGAWIALFAAGRAAGIDEKRLHSLYALKTRALALRLTTLNDPDKSPYFDAAPPSQSPPCCSFRRQPPVPRAMAW